MKILRILLPAVIALSMLLGACASNASHDNSAQYGVVKSINPTTETKSGLNVGTLIGGLIGGVAGHQFGSGRGNTAATAAGAIGGAVIGTDVGNRGSQQMYKIGVRLQNGNFVTVNQKASVAAIRVGERVKIENGQALPA